MLTKEQMEMISNGQMLTIAVHDGKFHADDVLAVVILKGVFKNIKIIRTRNSEKLAEANLRVDVGNKFSPSTGDFDHHMKEDAPMRDLDIRFAAAGLIWLQFGREYLAELDTNLLSSKLDKAWQLVDQRFVRPIDLIDNGQAKILPDNLSLSQVVSTFNPPVDSGENPDAAFTKAVNWLEEAFKIFCQSTIEDVKEYETVLTQIQLAKDGILILPKAGLPWLQVLKDHWDLTKDLKVLVFPDPVQEDNWRVQTLPMSPDNTFEMKCPAPSILAGKRDLEWRGNNIVFIHPGRFIGGCRGKLDDAVEFAKDWMTFSD